MSNQIAYEVIRRVMTDGALVERLNADAEGTLAAEGIDDAAVKSELIQILSLMFAGSTQQNAMAKKLEAQTDGTLDVATEMKNGLKRTLDQIDVAFRSTMLMYQVSFYLGVALVLAAIAVAFLSKDALLPAVFGSLGTVDVLTFFLAKPQEKLQSSRANLAQLQAALYNWFMDAVNQHTYLGVLQQQQKLDLATMQSISTTLMSHTDKTLELLQKYCKLV